MFSYIERPKSWTTCSKVPFFMRNHAHTMMASCGQLSAPQPEGTYRCDLERNHHGPHHACGDNWGVDF